MLEKILHCEGILLGTKMADGCGTLVGSFLERRRTMILLDPAESVILRFGEESGIFDLGRRFRAAEKVHGFYCTVGLAVDVGFVRVGRGMARNNGMGIVRLPALLGNR